MTDTSNPFWPGCCCREVDQRALTVTFVNELLNWLVSKRFYLETERNFLTSTYGAGSEQLSEHIRATSVAFDQFPGYRFMYKLRTTPNTAECRCPVSTSNAPRAAKLN